MTDVGIGMAVCIAGFDVAVVVIGVYIAGSDVACVIYNVADSVDGGSSIG